jgi:hypothetical protein
MIHVVMFDLGLTLIDENNLPFDHVRDALTAIASFKTADAKPLRSCLVSDFAMATPPTTAQKVRVLFNQYLGVLDQAGLRPFFEPVQKRVTLSTQAGALKPDRAVFETALRRLQVKATLEECLLVTENASHIKAVRNRLHMHALQFRAAGSGHFDFKDWSQAPAMIAHLIDPRHEANMQVAIKAYLTATGIELSNVEPTGEPHTFKVSGQMWCPVVVPGFADLQTVHVSLPVNGELTLGPKGELCTNVGRPTEEQIAEATAFVSSLAAHGQIALRGATRAASTTHEIATDDKGQRRLMRKRFSAL